MEVIVAALAAFIALLAWRAQRVHNRLSVSPFPTVGLTLFADRLKITVMNNGIGPMRVISLRFVDESGSSLPNVLKLVSTRDGVGITLMDGAALGPNRRRTLFKLNGQAGKNGSDVKATAAELARYKMVIEYTDVYGTKFVPYSRDLKWFTEDS
ncbi:hypothetical protein [Stenotrophomonas sp. 278]|uniref:hypothetical protein n=1 Tax=Stenotrophomonas sp. 278 TaxID=2479851 RepID=UPI000F684157|nr:hypothetical protein [Stenotrophomonas sp. 278]RRU23594.1 hypothetical protein EGJ34_02830 [Stenotrophomonas sp. 278]